MSVLHKEILTLLKEIDAICRKYDITYYAAGGTTIGAVRHRGFIPWDDDADIYMTRDNFYRFREAFKKERPKDRVLECLDDNKEYPATISRYIDDQTSMIGKFHILNTCSAGIVIDIFILDPVPDDEEKQREYIAKLYAFSDYVMPYYVFSNRADTEYLHIYNEYQELEKKIGRDAVIKRLARELFSMKEENSNYYVLRWGTLPHVFPKEYFREPVYYPFEDMEVPMPTMWYEYLVQLYGPKWMYIPDHDNQGAHDHIIDVDHKYTNYLADADLFIDKEEALAMYYDRKQTIYERQCMYREYQDYVMEQNAKAVLASQKKYIEVRGFDVEEMFSERDYAGVIGVYQRYLEYQFSKTCIGASRHSMAYRLRNPVFIPLPDHELYMLVYSLWFTGQYARAKKLMELRKRRGDLTQDLAGIDHKVNMIYGILQTFYQGDHKTAQEYIDQLSRRERRMPDVEKIQLQIEMALLDREGCQARLEEIRAIADEHPSDAEYMKILGDYYYNAGIEEEALSTYMKAEPGLTNGIMLLDITDKYHIDPNYDTPKRKPPLTLMQRAQFEILREIDEICRENDIKYTLFFKTLWYLWYHDNLPADSGVSLAMTPQNATAFIRAFEEKNPQGRRLDYAMVNADHNALSIDYINDDSLEFNWGNPANDGKPLRARIHILKIRGKNGMHWKYIRALDLAQILHDNAQRKKLKKKDRKARMLTAPIYALMGKEKIARTVFEGYCSMEPASPGECYYTTRTNGRRNIGKRIPARAMDRPDEMEIYGHRFMIPSCMDEMIPLIFGKDPETKYKLEDGSPTMMRFVDDMLGIDDFRQAVDTDLVDTQMYEIYREGVGMNKDVKRLGRVADYNLAILFRARDRFELFLKYMPMKDEIMQTYEAGDVDRLTEMFEDYLEAVERNLKRFNLGICFDQDILEAFVYCLEETGRDKLAKRLLENIPEEHFEPMKVLD